MSQILFLDTSGQESLVMLARRGQTPVCRRNAVQKDHGQLINRHLAEVMAEASVDWQNIEAVCVLNGPGSYTGLRMSLGTAKGLCYARDLPLVLLNKLDLMFQHIPLEQRADENGMLLKARTGEYFFAVYGRHGECFVEPGLSTTDEIRARLSSQTLKLFSIDQEPEADFAELSLLTWNEDVLSAVCFAACEARQYADLFLSEPFYLKNVHINKINNL